MVWSGSWRSTPQGQRTVPSSHTVPIFVPAQCNQSTASLLSGCIVLFMLLSAATVLLLLCCCCAVGLLRHQLRFTTCLSWDQDWLNSLRAVHLASVPLRKDNEIITLITLLLKRSFPQRNSKSTYPLN